MCGRFTMTWRDRSELAAMLGVHENELGEYIPRFNIAPTQPYFVLKTKYENREAIPATWGLVNSWAKDASRAGTAMLRRVNSVKNEGPELLEDLSLLANSDAALPFPAKLLAMRQSRNFGSTT
jgi:hypothetical protein